ncbi:hypothetical protein GP5015_47 [gamma proteobacterium HTCC5015]|nr:hypothetical protein GP5015_47 [gamma proteobacterium HTCC5015]
MTAFIRFCAFFVLFLPLILAGCGGSSGGGSGDGSGQGSATLGNCEYRWPNSPTGLHFKFDIVDGGNTGLNSDYSVQYWWVNTSSGGEIQGNNTKNPTIRSIQEIDFSSDGAVATLALSYSGGSERYVLTPTSPRQGTYEYTAESGGTDYQASGTYDLPASVLSSCGDLNADIDGVDAFENALDKPKILNGRSADRWLIDVQAQPPSHYMFTQNGDSELVVGQLDAAGNTYNEVEFTIPSGAVGNYLDDLPPNYLTSIHSWNALQRSSVFDYSRGGATISAEEAIQLGKLGLTPGSVQALAGGGWLLSPYPYSEHVQDNTKPQTPLTIQANGSLVQRPDPSGPSDTYYTGRDNLYALSSGGYASLIQDSASSLRLQLYDQNMQPNTSCSSARYEGINDTVFAAHSRRGGVWYSNLSSVYGNPLTEGEDGSIYIAYTNTAISNNNRLYIEKWNTNCAQQWRREVGVDVQYTRSVLTSVFKAEGDYIYMGYLDSLPSSSNNGLSRYTFLRAHTANGAVDIIRQHERYTRYDFGDVFDVAEDNNGDLFLGHGASVEKIDGTTFKSLAAFAVSGTRPVTPLHFDGQGNLQVNYRYVVTPSALAELPR